jgi:hypothetical protein
LFDVVGVQSLGRLVFVLADEDGERACDEQSVDDEQLVDDESMDVILAETSIRQKRSFKIKKMGQVLNLRLAASPRRRLGPGNAGWVRC